MAPVAPRDGCISEAMEDVRESTFATGSFTTTHGSSEDCLVRIESLLEEETVDGSAGVENVKRTKRDGEEETDLGMTVQGKMDSQRCKALFGLRDHRFEDLGCPEKREVVIWEQRQ